MGSKEHKEQAPHAINFVVITLSDTRTEKTDASGKILMEILERAGNNLKAYMLIPNDSEKLEELLSRYTSDDSVDAIITVGGTGISRKDITIEVVTRMLTKKLDGFGEIFRMLSYKEIGVSAIMSRAIAGVINGKVIVCLPGSASAVKLAATEILISELGHMVYEAKR
ncbi:MAG: MogA/MoaB family molybdenum cofactor biosynthesis protein [Thermoplasmata archaeon]